MSQIDVFPIAWFPCTICSQKPLSRALTEGWSQMERVRLHVNIDHIATLRQARREVEP